MRKDRHYITTDKEKTLKSLFFLLLLGFITNFAVREKYSSSDVLLELESTMNYERRI